VTKRRLDAAAIISLFVASGWQHRGTVTAVIKFRFSLAQSLNQINPASDFLRVLPRIKSSSVAEYCHYRFVVSSALIESDEKRQTRCH
jgi:hypothetical protein